MDDLPFVQVIQAGEDLSTEIADERFFEGTVIAEQGSNRAAGNILKENVQVVLICRRVCYMIVSCCVLGELYGAS